MGQEADSSCTMSKLVFVSPTPSVVHTFLNAGLYYHPLVLLDVDFVSDADEGEVLGVTRTCLDQELVFPVV